MLDKTAYLFLKRDIEPLEFMPFKSVNDHLIAARGDNIWVSKNVCPHRGMRVADECGKLPLKCQYHGRKFEWDRGLNLAIFGEMVFYIEDARVNLTGNSYLAEIGNDLGEEFGHYKMNVAAPFQLWVQNTADPNHLPTVHKANFSALFSGLTPFQVQMGENSSSYKMPINAAIMEQYRAMRSEPSVFGDGFFHMLVFPHLSITSFLGVFYSIETATPIDDKYCQVHTRFFVSKKANVPGLLKRLALKSNIQVLKEDRDLITKLASSTAVKDHDPKWMPGEERIKHYCDHMEALCAR